ncbi:hypothetical protein ACHAXT_010979 [Thalassiosira profunda]
MRRKPKPQDRLDAASSSLPNVSGRYDESTPQILRKLRLSPPSSGNTPPPDHPQNNMPSAPGSASKNPSTHNRGMLRIDHGSADWRSSSDAGSVNSNDEMVPPPGSPGRMSPGAEGLVHRRHKPPHDEPAYVTSPQNRRAPQMPLAMQMQQLNAQGYRGRSKFHGNGNLQRNRRAHAWKLAAQCLLGAIVAGYLLFVYLAQNHYWKEEHRLPNIGDRMEDRPARTPSRGESNAKVPPSPSSGKVSNRGQAGRADAEEGDDDGAGEDDDDDDHLSTPARKPFSTFALGRILRDRTPKDPGATGQAFDINHLFGFDRHQSTVDEPAMPMPGATKKWQREATSSGAKRRSNRRQRSRPPVQKGDDMPQWYALDYSSESTIATVQQRWEDDTAKSSDDEGSRVDVSKYPLCGAHAKAASQRHPNNYLPPFTSPEAFLAPEQAEGYQPLGPNSRVMISGILTPLGLHLALALHRQCNVTSFLGLDTQMPNDPLVRLEQQERLSILMTELEDARQLQVPFMGLEVRQTKKRRKQRRDELDRESGLVSVREAYEDGVARRQMPFTKPYHQFGIPLTPGTTSDGSGPLEALLEYRPTHVVHLAGTQADSLLNSEPHSYTPGGNEDDHSSSRRVFRNRREEEEGILWDSISSRPHLYDLRMGATGMEQLLSAAVAQTMLMPDRGSYRRLSDLDKAKMKRPHVVYASSYDALRFRDAAERLNNQQHGKLSKKTKQRRNHGGDDEEVLGSASPHAAKRPPRGLHGASRLIDEILASSYHALHGVSSVGLRFDAIYGPRGFGAPSASVPLFHVDRVRRRRGVSPDVSLAEAAVRGLNRPWMDMIKQREKEAELEAAAAEAEAEAEAEAVGGEQGDAEEKGARRRLGEEWQRSLVEEAGWTHLANDRRDFVFVEDAVGAIIAAMQYRSADGSPSTFNIGSGETSTLQSLSDEIQHLAAAPGDVSDDERRRLSSKDVIDVERSSAARAASLSSKEYLRWSTTTSLGDGAARLLAWHLDRALPFFPPSSLLEEEVDYSMSIAAMKEADPPMPIPLDGEAILSRRGISSCSEQDDLTCMRETHATYPCASECSIRACIPSVFDSVVEHSQEATEDCEVVLYTMALGYDVEELALETEYSDGDEQTKWMETPVCTIAFVPSESSLVRDVIDQVPPNEFEKREIDPNSSYETKVDGLNGYLAHNGWVLILVDDAINPLTAEDMFLAKLAPARLFHESVRKAMFVDENFSHIPYPDDAQFLASETSRGMLPKRTVYGVDEKGQKTKYKLPEEPQRRAVLLVSPMRHIPEVEGHRMPLREITQSMMKEQGLETEDGETKEIRIQREYYERARSAINSMDLRSPYSTLRHRIEIKDFIRSRWIVHHLKLEEGHLLRCEWYREHVKWSTHLDQLSFAYIMARRELARKITTRQPVPPAKSEKLSMLEQVIRLKSDAHEWHPIINDASNVLPIHHSQISPEAIPLNLEDQYEISDSQQELAFDDEDSTFYVRIMSDDRMLESRKIWMKARAIHRKRVTAYKAMMAKQEAETAPQEPPEGEGK